MTAKLSRNQIQGEKGFLSLAEKSDDPVFVPQQQVRNRGGPSVSHVKPYYLWRMASEETELTEVFIL